MIISLSQEFWPTHSFTDIGWHLLCTALLGSPTFQVHWSLNFVWVIFHFKRFCCRFAAVLSITVLLHHPVLSQAVGEMASHLTLQYFEIQRSWWSTQQSDQVLLQQNKPKSSPFHHRVWQLVLGVCDAMLYMVRCGAMHYGQTSPLQSHLSKGKAFKVFTLIFIRFFSVAGE